MAGFTLWKQDSCGCYTLYCCQYVKALVDYYGEHHNDWFDFCRIPFLDVLDEYNSHYEYVKAYTLNLEYLTKMYSQPQTFKDVEDVFNTIRCSWWDNGLWSDEVYLLVGDGVRLYFTVEYDEEEWVIQTTKYETGVT